MALLITGASGMVGVEVVRALLRRPSPPPLRLLLRGNPAERDAKLRWILDWAGFDRSSWPPDQVVAVPGDIRHPELGMDRATWDRARSEVTGILHAAAETGFQVAEAKAYDTNVAGTRHVLDFAASCPRLQRVGVVGTAYVAGRRSGRIHEEDLPPDGEFFNVYERSKAAAEAEVRARAQDLPIALYRLGITVGRQTDGKIARFGVIYLMWRLVYQGLVPMFPGDPEAPLDLIPVDFAAEALAHLLLESFSPGNTVHLVAGPERSFTFGAFYPALVEAIRAADPTWERHGYPTPMCVDARTFAAFVDTVDLIANRRLRQIIQIVRAFTLQTGAPKWFETRALYAGLDGSGLSLPHASAWLPVLLHHAVEAGFQSPAPEVAHGQA